MVWKFLILLGVMFVVFIILYCVTGIIASIMAEENRHTCRNCEYYDKAMGACLRIWRKAEPAGSCKRYRKAKEVRR